MPEQVLGQGASFSFTKICVADLDRSAAFYARIFGMKEWSRHETPTLREIMLKSSDAAEAPTLVLMKPIPGEAIVLGTGYGPLGMIVSDVGDIVSRVRKSGCAVTKEPYSMTELGISVAFVADPDGHPIEIVQILKP